MYLTNLLHGAESFLRSWPVFAASQEIPCIFMQPESSLSYSQVPATRPYPEPTLSSPHDSLQLPEDLLFKTAIGAVRLRIYWSPEEASHIMSISEQECFNGEGLLAPRPTPKLEDHP